MASTSLIPFLSRGLWRVLIGGAFTGVLVMGTAILVSMIAGQTAVQDTGSTGASIVHPEAIKVFADLQAITPIATLCFVFGALGAYVRTLVGQAKLMDISSDKPLSLSDQTVEARALVGGFFGFLSCLALKTGALQTVLFGSSLSGTVLIVTTPGYLFFASLSGLLSTELFWSIEGAVRDRLKTLNVGGKQNGR